MWVLPACAGRSTKTYKQLAPRTPVKVARRLHLSPDSSPQKALMCGLKGTPETLQGQTQKTSMGLSLLANGREVISGAALRASPRIPGAFTLPHRSHGTLGRGPRSELPAPGLGVYTMCAAGGPQGSPAPQTPPKGFFCLLLPSAALHKNDNVSQQTTAEMDRVAAYPKA